MEDEKIDLKWGTFCTQLAASLGALACAVFASTRILTPNPIYSAQIDALLGGALILVPFFVAARLLSVPYRTDEFERRLRNWSMTLSAIIVLVTSATTNLGAHSASPGDTPISPYMSPALFLICHTLYSQYLRYRIAHGQPNAFTGKET